MRNPESLHLGGPLAIGLFVFSLIAFVTETQLTQVGYYYHESISFSTNWPGFSSMFRLIWGIDNHSFYCEQI